MFNLKTKKMKVKIIFFSSLFLLAAYTMYVANTSQNVDKYSSLLLKNLEAFSMDENGNNGSESNDHGNIDNTLVPYEILSSKEIWMNLWGEWKKTTVPCCDSSDSQYSGCARGLDKC